MNIRKTKCEDYIDGDEPEVMDSRITIDVKQDVISTYDAYIYESISGIESYVPLIKVLRNAEAGDVVNIFLNTNGGELMTTFQILNAMDDSSAEVVTILDGKCYSAGALIFLSGDKQIVKKHGILMLHEFSTALEGKGVEVFGQAKFQNEYYSDFLDNIHKKILTKKERKLVKTNEIWMSSEEVKRRLELED